MEKISFASARAPRLKTATGAGVLLLQLVG
jgi:hypothetical protein